MTLTDALAAALHQHGAAHSDSYDPWEWESCGLGCAAGILADPAFCEALTAALAEAVPDLDGMTYPTSKIEVAEDIVARLLRTEGVRG